MTTLEELKAQREKEANKLMEANKKLASKREKKKIKEDIRSIKAARLRSTLGVSRESVGGIGSTIGKAYKGSAPQLKKIGIGAGKFLMGVGEGAARMQGSGVGGYCPARRPSKKRKKQKTKKRKSRTIIVKI